MPIPDTLDSLTLRRDRIQQEFVSLGDLRPGLLTRRFLQCGKPRCRCQLDGATGHGPYWSLTFKVQGKTVTRSIPAAAVERTREQIAEHKRFRALAAELADLPIDPKRVERAAEALGGEIAEDECVRIESEPPSAPTMVLGMDGTGVPVRPGETEGRAGKQPDGSSKTREVELVTLWTAESLDKQGRPRRDPVSVSYSAAIESAATRDTGPDLSAFARRVRREAEHRGFGLAKRQVVVGDGAPWIWNVTGEQFPEAIEIVDLYHAQEKIWDASRALHAGDPPRLREWAEAGCEALAEGRLDDLLGALRSGAAECEQVRQCAEYIECNRDRMQYADFRAQGLSVGSGVVEAGCKTTIGTRLKRAGMHWSVHGANTIIALRCCYLSGRFEDFWERRSVNR